MSWFGTKLNKFWSDVFHRYSEVYRHNFPPSPETAILGWSQQVESLSHWKTLSIQYGVVIAKKIVLKVLNKELSPCFETWLTEFSSNLWKKLDMRCGEKRVTLNRYDNLSLTVLLHWGDPHDTSNTCILNYIFMFSKAQSNHTYRLSQKPLKKSTPAVLCMGFFLLFRFVFLSLLCVVGG